MKVELMTIQDAWDKMMQDMPALYIEEPVSKGATCKVAPPTKAKPEKEEPEEEEEPGEAKEEKVEKSIYKLWPRSSDPVPESGSKKMWSDEFKGSDWEEDAVSLEKQYMAVGMMQARLELVMQALRTKKDQIELEFDAQKLGD